MLIAFTKEFARRKVGTVENLPDRAAALFVRKGYAMATDAQPTKSKPVRKPHKKTVKK